MYHAHVRSGSIGLLLAQVVLFCSAADPGDDAGARVPARGRFPQLQKQKIRDVPLAYVISCLTAIATAAVWAVCRNQDWAWMLQDALGVTLIMFFIRTIQLPSLKVRSRPQLLLCSHRGPCAAQRALVPF